MPGKNHAHRRCASSLAAVAGIPAGMRNPETPGAGGVARVRRLNHRLQAAIPAGFVLFTRCLPRISNGLANMPATLGSSYWLGLGTHVFHHVRSALLGSAHNVRACHPATGGHPSTWGLRVDLSREACLRAG